MKEETNLVEEQKILVLERFKTLNPESKIMLGSDGEVTVTELIDHIEKGDEFGKKVVRVQMKMLKILSGGAWIDG